jgi:hypothetical protein
MLERLLLLLFVVTYTIAQYEGTGCIAVTPSSSSFCYNSTDNVITYNVPISTDFKTADSNALSSYQTTLALISGNISSSCENALRTYFCEKSFFGCSYYNTTLTNVCESHCADISTYCGTISGFTPVCTTADANPLCVDAFQPLCQTRVVVPLGAQCGTQSALSNVNFNQTQYCGGYNQCVNNGSVSVCSHSTYGSNCTSTCAGDFPTQGDTLQCISGVCTLPNKRNGDPCSSNQECRNNQCINGVCVESTMNCTTDVNCAPGLYCDLYNMTCYPQSTFGQLCGQLQIDWTPVPCQAPYTCVRANNSVLATCQLPAQLGQACSVQTNAVVYSAPLCIPSPTTLGALTASCVNGICTSGMIPLNQACNVTQANPYPCEPNALCQEGVCVPANTVSCDTRDPVSACNTKFQYCACSGISTQGVCTVDPTNPYNACTNQLLAIYSCIQSNCSMYPDFYPNDGYSCGYKKCEYLVNPYYCCVFNATGMTLPSYCTPTTTTTIPTTTTTTVIPTITSTPTTAGPTPPPGVPVTITIQPSLVLPLSSGYVPPVSKPNTVMLYTSNSRRSFVSYKERQSSTAGNAVAYFQYNTSSIPSNAQIQVAVISFYIVNASDNGAVYFTLVDNSYNWNSNTISFSNQPQLTNTVYQINVQQGQNGPVNATVVSAVQTNLNNNYQTFTLKASVSQQKLAVDVAELQSPLILTYVLPSPPSGVNTNAIIGGVVGGVGGALLLIAIVIIIVVIVVIVMKKKKKPFKMSVQPIIRGDEEMHDLYG